MGTRSRDFKIPQSDHKIMKLTGTTLFFITQSLKPASNWRGAKAPKFVSFLVEALEEKEYERLKEIVGHPSPPEWLKELKILRI